MAAGFKPASYYLLNIYQEQDGASYALTSVIYLIHRLGYFSLGLKDLISVYPCPKIVYYQYSDWLIL